MTTDRHLVPVKPAAPRVPACPACGDGAVAFRGVAVPGIQVMGRHHCPACGLHFLQDLPVGHAIDHPITVGEDGRLFSKDVPAWLLDAFMRGLSARDEGPVAIERRVFKEHRRVVVLNTLDFLYGHVLLKLFNAQHYIDRHPDLGLVVILPRMYAWLIPEGTAEAWIVDLRLGQVPGWHTAIDRFVQERIGGYDEVHFARAYSHPDVSLLDMRRFTKVAAFPAERFDELPPHVTFVVRQDRLWYRWPLVKFKHRVVRRLGLAGLLGGLFTGDQERLARRTMALLRQAVPGITFSVVGLGRARSKGADVNDLRTERMDAHTETAWCEAYARSQVVVGVHGSNMLLPTALAGGCVEILPHDRLENIVQDVAVRYTGRMQLFLYRFVDEFASPRMVARQVASMFQHHRHYRRNNVENVF